METPTPTETPTETETSTPTPTMSKPKPVVKDSFADEDTDPEVQDILRSVAPTSPKEAVQTIERAEHLDIHPDSYEDMKSELDPEMDIQKRVPAQVSEPVKKFMGKSSKHAEVAKEEIGLLDLVSKQASHVWYNLTEKHVLEKEIQELNNKDRTSENGITDFEKEYLNSLYDMQQEEIQEFGLEGYQEVPGQVAGVVNDMFQAIQNNMNLVTLGAFTGGGIGLLSPTAPITAPAGFIAGAGLGVTSAMALDAYFKIADSTYGELSRMKNDDGTPMNLSRGTKDNIAMSVGAISGVLEAFTGKVLTGGLAKLASPKTAAKFIVKSPAMKSAADILGHATKSAITSGGEEVSAEIAAIVGENYAKGVQTEEGLMNAMLVTAEQIVSDPETQKRLKMTAVVGVAAGGGIAGTTGALTYGKGKRGYEQVQVQEKAAKVEAELDVEIEKVQKIQKNIETSVQLSSQSINHQTGVLKLAVLMEQTELKKLSPAMTSEFMQDSLTKAGYENNVWFSQDDINTISETDPNMADKIRDMDVTESTDSGSGASVGLSSHQFLDLVGEVPTVSEYARVNPESPNPLESKNLLKTFNEAETKRREIFSSLGVDEQLSPEQIDILEQLDQGVDKQAREAGEQGFVDDLPTFSEVMKESIPDKDIDQITEAQTKAKEAVWLEVTEDFEAKEKRIESKVMRLNDKIIKEEEQAKLADDIRIVNQFRYDKTAPKVESHKKKGHATIAIDPNSLPVDLREAYVTEPKLKKRKVFVEGGLTVDEAAARAGVESGEELLKILANTPTKKEMMVTRRKKSAEVKNLVEESRAVNLQKRRDEAFDNYNKLQLKELKFMKQHEWGTTKKEIKKIALPLPRIEELNNSARNIVKRTKVGEVNAKQFNAGEKTQQKKAVNHILKNEVELAFLAKEKAMMNSELTRESLRAKEQIVKDKAFVKKLSDKSNQKSLKKAGLDTQVNEILNLFDLTGSKPKGERQASYFEYLSTLEQRGETIVVPETLSDIRQRGTDLTVEQHGQIVERLRTLKHQAKTKNKLLKSSEKRAKNNKLQTEEAVVTDAALDLQEHVDYDEGRLKVVANKNSKTTGQRIVEKMSILSAMQTNAKNVAVQLDGEALGGKHYENLIQPMVEAETNKRNRTHEVVGHIKKIMADYGEVEFTAAFNEFIDIPEFAGIAELGNGSMARSDLWTLFSFLGDPQARERIQNFVNPETEVQMDIETFTRVLERTLSEKDAKLAQNFTNIFKSFEGEAKALHERTTGVTPTMVKGVPIEFNGKVYDGGYVPLNYLNTSKTEKVSRFLEVMGDKKLSMFGEQSDNKLYSKLRAAEMTDQGRLIDRSGSSQPLDADFRNFLSAYEEHSHDIAYREAGTDVLKLLRNPVYSNSIISTVGGAKYDTLVNGVIETVGKTHAGDDMSPFSTDSRAILNLYKRVEQGFSIATLGFKLSSVLMQPLSFGAASLRMGNKGGRYLVKAVGESLKALGTGDYDTMWNAAVEINPDLKFNKDSIDDSLIASTFDFIPESQKGKYSNTTAIFKKGQQFLIDTSMMGLKKLDIHIKAAATMGAYTQFMNGDVKNFSNAKLDKMTDAQKEIAARKYAKQIADLALTTSADIDKSAIEKVTMMRFFTRFYTDLRSQLNTGVSQVRKVRTSGKQAKIEFKKGDTTKGLSHVKSAAMDAGSLVAVYTLMQMYTDSLYDEETPLTELSKVGSMDDLKNFVGNTTMYALGAPVKGLAGSTVGVRDVQFSLGSNRARKQVRFPVNRVFSDVSMSITGLADMLEGEELSGDQKKSMLYVASYVSGGIPVRGPEELVESFKESETFGDVGAFMRRESGRLAQNISNFIDKYKDDEKMQDTIVALKEVHKEVVPTLEQQTDIVTPEDSMEVLKMNEWNDLDPNTGAAGIYQFTEKAWNELSEKNPNLGLTEEGRVSKNDLEQREAMVTELEENTKGLTAYQVDVDNSSLYGAHRFGLEDYVMISLSKNNDKLKGLVENEELFEGFETVADVKRFIKKKLEGTDSNS